MSWNRSYFMESYFPLVYIFLNIYILYLYNFPRFYIFIFIISLIYIIIHTQLSALNLSSPLSRLWWCHFWLCWGRWRRWGEGNCFLKRLHQPCTAYPRLLLHWINNLIWLSYYNQLPLSATKPCANHPFFYPISSPKHPELSSVGFP